MLYVVGAFNEFSFFQKKNFADDERGKKFEKFELKCN